MKSLCLSLMCAGTMLAGALPGVANAGTYTVLYAFQGGADGANPYGRTLRDAQGNIYGTAVFGGANCTTSAAAPLAGCGTVWQLTPAGKLNVLVTFNGSNGAVPTNLALYKDKLYGTTQGGGASDNGVVFSVTKNGTFSLLHSFNGADGCAAGQPSFDNLGNLFSFAGCGTNNSGEIFKIDAAGNFSVIYTAPATAPIHRVIADNRGHVYTTQDDPTCTSTTGCGQLIRLNADGTNVQTIFNFNGTQSGFSQTAPHAPDLAFLAGNTLVGVSVLAASPGGGSVYNAGGYFSVNVASRTFTLIHAINPAAGDGIAPFVPGLGSNGVVYGETFYGGPGSLGTVFSLTSTGVYTQLMSFGGGTSYLTTGAYAEATPVWDNASQTLYGSTFYQGPSTPNQNGACVRPDGTVESVYGCGVIFSEKP